MGMTVVCVSGPSGAGKGTLVKMALNEVTEYAFGKSLTTRTPRDEDTMYEYAASVEAFFARVDAGELIEWSPHFGHYYGKLLPRPDRPTLLELDVNGAESVKAKIPETKKVLVTVPGSLEEQRDTLCRRILGREPDIAPAQLHTRLDRMQYEIEFAMSHRPDLIITNGDGLLQEAAAELADFLRAQLAA